MSSLPRCSFPRGAEDAFSDFQKLGSRSYLVISIVMVASMIETASDGTVCDARIAVGACSPVAQRLTHLESDLRGRMSDRIGGLADKRSPSSLWLRSTTFEPRGAYRLEATLTLIRRSLAPPGGGRVIVNLVGRQRPTG